MSTNDPSADPLANASREEIVSALFANLVVQQTNMAFMFLGRVPHPETGEVLQDLESAKFFIDQLEMIEVKTKGNLDKREEGLLKQSLTGLRMAFVEAADGKGNSPGASIPTSPEQKPAIESAQPATASAPESKPVPDEESRKKFSKKY